MVPKILITGPPGCGKTTLMERLIDSLDIPSVGFLTGETRSGGRRIGFDIETLGGGRGILARTVLSSPAKVGRYGVDIPGFERLLKDEFSRERMAGAGMVLMDEIGPMEWHSQLFRRLAAQLIGNPVPLVATISLKGPPGLQDLKRGVGVTLMSLPPWRQDPEAALRILQTVDEKLGLSLSDSFP